MSYMAEGCISFAGATPKEIQKIAELLRKAIGISHVAQLAPNKITFRMDGYNWINYTPLEALIPNIKGVVGCPFEITTIEYVVIEYVVNEHDSFYYNSEEED